MEATRKAGSLSDIDIVRTKIKQDSRVVVAILNIQTMLN